MQSVFRILICVLLVAIGAGCATTPMDYTAFQKHHPSSILVLPPKNQSVAVEAPYSYLSAVTKPLAEIGYYVFPVAVVDQFMKENGLPTPDEMHGVSLSKLDEILGADSVMYITINNYGTKYQVTASVSVVTAEAQLVDVKTGTQLWEGSVTVKESTGNSNNSLLVAIVSAAINQVVNTSRDRAAELCPKANWDMFWSKKRGLLYGPRHALHGKEEIPQ